MKNFKRIVGLLLCLAMVLSFVPASVVSAAESTGTTTYANTNDVLEKIDITGTAVGACSTDSASKTDYDEYTWYNETAEGIARNWTKHLKLVDGNITDPCSFGTSNG